MPLNKQGDTAGKPPVKRKGKAPKLGAKGAAAIAAATRPEAAGRREAAQYKELPHAERTKLVKSGGATPAQRQVHEDRVRSQGYLDAFERWAQKSADRHPQRAPAPAPSEDVVKGARIAWHLQGRKPSADAQNDALVREQASQPKPEPEHHGLFDKVLHVGKAAAAAVEAAGSLRDPIAAAQQANDGGSGSAITRRGYTGSDATAALGQAATLVKGAAGAAHALDRGRDPFKGAREAAAKEAPAASATASVAGTVKGVNDGTSTVLKQTSRLSSASAGGTLAALSGKNPLSGAWQGLLKNDKSYQQVAEKLGLHGADALLVGLVGDVFLDLSTYASFGLKAPAEAAELAARARLMRKYGAPIRRAAKAGDTAKAEAIHASFRRELDAAVAKASRKGSEHRGIQAGVRLPGGRTYQTSGATTAKVFGGTTGRVAGKIAQGKVNRVLTSLSPKIRATGISRAEHATLRSDQRVSDALVSRISTEGTNVGRYIQKATHGDQAKINQIVDAIEAGDLSTLTPRLRTAAERQVAFHEDVAARYERLTGKPLRLAETVIPGEDVDAALKVARDLLDRQLQTAKRGASSAAERLARTKPNPRPAAAPVDPSLSARQVRAAEREAGTRRAMAGDTGPGPTPRDVAAAKVVQAQAKVDHADELMSRLADLSRPMSRQEERDLVDELGRIIDEATAHLPEDAGAGVSKIKASIGRMEGQIDEPTPVGHIMRQRTAFMDGEPGKAVPVQHISQAEAGFEQTRKLRGLMSTLRETHPNIYSEALPYLEAKYGVDAARRLGSLSLYKAVAEAHSVPATADAILDAKRTGAAIFHVDDEGRLTEVVKGHGGDYESAHDLAVETARRADEAGVPVTYEHIVVPEGAARLLAKPPGSGHGAGWQAAYDSALRTWKSMATVFRPGFFATSLLGNHWQQFLMDVSPAEMAGSYRTLAELRKMRLEATTPDAAVRKAIMGKIGPSHAYVTPDGTRSFADLVDEALDWGAARTGSRLSDPAELTLEAQANRRLGGAGTRTAEWLGQLSEDIDDMTRLTLYIRGRTKLGMTPRQATEHAYSGMIDYHDLTELERRTLKRVMPFYVYTSRNMPMQVRRLLARPGKLANFEKVREALAEASGLPSDWASQIAPGDQERMPFPVPGLKSAGFQWFQYLRLPVEDISRPSQLAEGDVGRIATRYVGDMAPFIKLPAELISGQRFDYGRPISLPGTPPEAGTILRALPAFLHATKPGQFESARTGKKYTATNAKLDYVLRSLLTSWGSAGLNIGKTVPDRSNIPAAIRTPLSILAGQGANAPDPLAAKELILLGQKDKLIKRRSELSGRGQSNTVDYYRVSDALDAVKDAITVNRAGQGYPAARKQLNAVAMRALQRATDIALHPYDVRVLESDTRSARTEALGR